MSLFFLTIFAADFVMVESGKHKKEKKGDWIALSEVKVDDT